MTRIPEAEARLMKNRFVCRNCKQVMHAPAMKVINKEVICKRCHCKALRPKRKK